MAGGPMMPYTDQRFPQYDQQMAYQQQMQQQYPQNNMVQLPGAQQQAQPQNQVPQLHGRFVMDPKDIAVNEVDMRGTVSIFPIHDMSCIYAKQWTADGKINTVKYVPITEEQPDVPYVPQVDYTPVMERLDRIEQLLSTRPASRSRKGDTENE